MDSSGHGPVPPASPGPVLAISGLRLAMRLAAGLMPPAAGRRWFAEADSFLDECGSQQRLAAARSWLGGVPQLIVVMWAARIARRAGRPGAVMTAPGPGRGRQLVRAGAAVVACLIAAGAFVAGEHHHPPQPGMTILTGRAYVGVDEASVTVGGWVYGLQGTGNVSWVDSQGSTHTFGWPACLTGPGQYRRVKFGEVPVTAPNGMVTRQIVWVDCQRARLR
jgi:hypothetical protein